MKNYNNYIKEYVNISKPKLDKKNIINIKSKEQLIEILTNFNVPLDDWGSGPYKTIEHLWNELNEEECVLFNINGTLRREVNFVGAKIYYNDGEKRYFLKEEKAMFKDGRVRIRKIWYSMAEKFKFDEDPTEALIRGMKEELDITINENQTTYYNKVYFPSDDDYPGIKSFHTGYNYLIVLNEDQYNINGYIEHQSDKDIYFKWKEIKYNQT